MPRDGASATDAPARKRPRGRERVFVSLLLLPRSRLDSSLSSPLFPFIPPSPVYSSIPLSPTLHPSIPPSLYPSFLSSITPLFLLYPSIPLSHPSIPLFSPLSIYPSIPLSLFPSIPPLFPSITLSLSSRIYPFIPPCFFPSILPSSLPPDLLAELNKFLLTRSEVQAPEPHEPETRHDEQSAAELVTRYPPCTGAREKPQLFGSFLVVE